MATDDIKLQVQKLVDSASNKNDGGDWDGAIADCDEAIKLDPTNDEAYSVRGFAKTKLGRHTESLADLDEAIFLNSGVALNFSNRGYLKNELGNHKEALIDLTEAIRLDASNSVTFSNRGFANSRLGKLKEAVKDCNEAIRLDSKNAFAYINRGYANLYLGNFDDANEDFIKAQELAPGNREVIRAILGITAAKAREDTQEQIEASLQDEANLFEGNREVLLKEAKKREITVYCLNGAILATWQIMVVVIAWYIWFVLWPMLITRLEPTIGYFFYLTVLLVLIFPFIWGIRILLAIRQQNQIMREDCYRRALLEATIRQTFRQRSLNALDPNNKYYIEQEAAAWANYIHGWMYHSPAEMLVMLNRGKGSDMPQLPNAEAIVNSYRKSQ